MLKVKNVNDYSAYLGHSAQHRWVSVIDYAEVTPIRHSLCNYSVYGLFLRDDILIDLTYGLGKYDYNKGTLICVAPGQIGGKEDDGERGDDRSSGAADGTIPRGERADTGWRECGCGTK